ncbi:hypothetical protein QR680_003522 [Steinernema hermaphroditum]|uniref:RBR-type E3 ubiquitin transferase n=1 Tax=Steinernema hermaphroditum TaxID=289476 RepID=A0AA39HLP4_9BILA|nr:hypothetical protein QR680_003522 [Steinernema hermaphroditum]
MWTFKKKRGQSQKSQPTAMDVADSSRPRVRRAHDEILEKQNELIRLVKLYPLEEIEYQPPIRDYNVLYDALVDTFGEDCIGGSSTYPFRLPCQISEFNVEGRNGGLRFDAHLKIDDYVIFEFNDERMVTRCFVNACCLPDHRPLLPVIDNILYRILDRTVIQHVYCESELYVRDHLVEKFEERHYCWGSRISSTDVRSTCDGCGIPKKDNPAGAATLQCGHYFCFDCWVQYITRRIATKQFPMYCPKANCQILQPAGGLLTFIPKALVDYYGNCIVDKEIADANTKFSKCWRCDELILLGVPLKEEECPIEIIIEETTDDEEQEEEEDKPSGRDSSYESESPEPRFNENIRIVICECGAATCCDCRLKAHEPLSCEAFKRYLEVNGEYVAPTFSTREQLEEFLVLSQFEPLEIGSDTISQLRRKIEEENDEAAIEICKQMVNIRL